MLDDLKLGIVLAKLYWRETPYLGKLKELCAMKISTNTVTQGVATVAQMVNAGSGLVPPKYQFWVAAALGLLQLIGSILGHLSNPDGTPVAMPYVPK